MFDPITYFFAGLSVVLGTALIVVFKKLQAHIKLELTMSKLLDIQLDLINKLEFRLVQKTGSDRFTPEQKAIIGDKVSKIAELNARQLNLVSGIETPSASAAHSKYKRDLALEFAALDKEKIQLMSEVVSMGYDPELSVMDGDGIVKKMKMSQIISESNKLNATTSAPRAPNGKAKLTLIKTVKETDNECSEQNPK